MILNVATNLQIEYHNNNKKNDDFPTPRRPTEWQTG